MMSTVGFTAVYLNYLDKALTLFNSLKLQGTDRFYIVICNIDMDFVDLRDRVDVLRNHLREHENLSILTIDEIPGNWRSRLNGNSVVEVCTAVKASVALNFFRLPEVSQVIYLDPDILVFTNFESIKKATKDHAFVLTPHQTLESYTEEEALVNEIQGSMKHGVFNLGFFSCRRGEEAIVILRWWETRLKRFCYTNKFPSVFTDQKFFDLTPAVFPAIHILRESGFNVAPWNISQRYLYKRDETYFVNEKKLEFFHFSSFDKPALLQMLERFDYSGVGQELLSFYKSTLSQTNEFLEPIKGFLETQAKASDKIPHRKDHKRILLQSVLNSRRLRRVAKGVLSRFRADQYVRRFVIGILYPKSQVVTQHQDTSCDDWNYENVLISHNWKGGSFYIWKSLRNFFCVLAPLKTICLVPRGDGKYEVFLPSGTMLAVLSASEVKRFISNNKNVRRLVINHLIGFEEIFDRNVPDIEEIYLLVHDRFYLERNLFSLNGLDTDQVNSLENRIWHKRWSGLIENAALIFVPSGWLLKEMKRTFPKGRFVMSPWFDTQSSYPIVRSRLTNHANSFVLIGSTSEHKGVFEAISFKSGLKELGNESKVYLFGEVEPSIKKLLDQNEIYTMGYWPRLSMRRFILNLPNPVLLLPSVVEESYSLALNDGLALGVPILARNVGAYRERLAGRTETFLFNSSPNSMKELAKLVHEGRFENNSFLIRADSIKGNELELTIPETASLSRNLQEHISRFKWLSFESLL